MFFFQYQGDRKKDYIVISGQIKTTKIFSFFPRQKKEFFLRNLDQIKIEKKNHRKQKSRFK